MAKALLCLQHRARAADDSSEHAESTDRVRRLESSGGDTDHAAGSREKLTIGVNSFGFGGANAHVVLQSPDALSPAEHAADQRAAGSSGPAADRFGARRCCSQGSGCGHGRVPSMPTRHATL